MSRGKERGLTVPQVLRVAAAAGSLVLVLKLLPEHKKPSDWPVVPSAPMEETMARKGTIYEVKSTAYSGFRRGRVACPPHGPPQVGEVAMDHPRCGHHIRILSGPEAGNVKEITDQTDSHTKLDIYKKTEKEALDYGVHIVKIQFLD